ncbi:hypothetical protein ACJW31_05G053200 [Castanea mollissima]
MLLPTTCFIDPSEFSSCKTKLPESSRVALALFTNGTEKSTISTPPSCKIFKWPSLPIVRIPEVSKTGVFRFATHTGFSAALESRRLSCSFHKRLVEGFLLSSATHNGFQSVAAFSTSACLCHIPT